MTRNRREAAGLISPDDLAALEETIGFATAAERYLDELDRGSLTEQIDTALARLDNTDDSTDAAVGVGRRVLADSEW